MITKFIAWLIDEMEICVFVCIILLLIMSFLQFIFCINKRRILKFIPLSLTVIIAIVAVFNIIDAHNYKPNGLDNMISVAIMIWSFLLLAMCLGCLLGWLTAVLHRKLKHKEVSI